MATIFLSTRDTRLACLKASGALFCAGILLFALHRPLFTPLFWASGMLCCAGLAVPRLAALLFAAAAKTLSWSGLAALALFYFLVLTPWALVCKAGRGKRDSGRKQSCWEPCEEQGRDSFERQY